MDVPLLANISTCVKEQRGAMALKRNGGQDLRRRLTVAHLITGLEFGGAEWMLKRLVTRMDRDRFHSVVISMLGPGKLGAMLVAEGIRLECLGLRRGVADPFAIVRLARILHACRPHILQTWLYHADLLGAVARLLGYAPSLLWNIRCSESVGAGLVRSACRRLSAIPDVVVVNSLAGQRFHERLGYRPKCWQFIPNGVDTGELRPDDNARNRLRVELGIPKEAITIGIAARYHAMKDYATFLAAAAMLARRRTDVIFVLAGSGTDRNNRDLVTAIDARGLTDRTRLLGECSDMRLVYPAFDISSLTSAFGEGFPNVLAEAMSCGVPCVATESGDSREIIGDTGLVVRSRDPAALASAWEQLIDLDTEERRALGKKARDRIVESYDLAGIVDRYQMLYAELSNAVS